MIVWDEGRLRFGEVWFDEELDAAAAGLDVVRLRQCARPPNHASCELNLSLQLNLTRSMEHLLCNVKPAMRAAIEAAAEAGSTDRYDVLDAADPRAVEGFFEFCDGAVVSGQLVMSRAHDTRGEALAELRRYADAGVLDMSRVASADGGVLTWRANFATRETASSIVVARVGGGPSVSSCAGVADCGHLWRDAMRFRDAGLRTYDFGGWSYRFDDLAEMAESDFRAEFGGSLVRQANCWLGLSAVGRTWVRAHHIAQRASGHRPWWQR
ncbi:MAG: hypothetical protein HY876_10960 [Coriobacteriales bacterium]|nr:hypothetical protein [Coriobacteriales bacterium]